MELERSVTEVFDMVKEAVRRSVRAAANHSWGKKPVVTVFVTRI